MQDEALADLDATSLDAADDDAYTLCLYRPELAPGRGRHRRVAAQGPLPPPGDRVRARAATASSRAPAARSPASICATRSTSWPSARPALIARFGGHAFAAGLTLARIGPAALRRGLRGGGARAADAGATSRARSKRDGALAPRRARLELAAALRDRVWGQGFPAPTFDARFRRARTSGSSAAAHSSSRSRAAASASTRSCSATPSRCRRAIRAAYPAGDQRVAAARRSLQLVIEHWQPRVDRAGALQRIAQRSIRASAANSAMRRRIADCRRDRLYCNILIYMTRLYIAHQHRLS